MPTRKVAGIRSYVTRSDVKLSQDIKSIASASIGAYGFRVPTKVSELPTLDGFNPGNNELENIKTKLSSAIINIEQNRNGIDIVKQNISQMVNNIDKNALSTTIDIDKLQSDLSANIGKTIKLESDVSRHNTTLQEHFNTLDLIDKEITNIKSVTNDNFDIQGNNISLLQSIVDETKNNVVVLQSNNDQNAFDIESIKKTLNNAVLSGGLASENKSDISSLTALINEIQSVVDTNKLETKSVINDVNTLSANVATGISKSDIAFEKSQQAYGIANNISNEVLSLAKQTSNINQNVSGIQLQLESVAEKQNIVDDFTGNPVKMFNNVSPLCSSVFMSFATIGTTIGGTYIGSGCFITLNNNDLKDGLFLTCGHNVLRQAETSIQYIQEAFIENPINKEWLRITPNMVFADGVGDIALIKTGISFVGSQYTPIRLASIPARTGDTCFVIGDPAGMDSDSLVRGIVRSGNYEMKPISYQINECIYIDASTTGGNSGGPILNTNGEIIGMLTYGSDGMATFCGGPNVRSLRSSLDVLSKFHHNKEKKYLGLTWGVQYPMTLYAIKNSINSQLSPTTKGVRVYSIDPSSPFYGTLKVGDVITSIKTHDLNGSIIETFNIGVHDDESPLGVLLYKYDVQSITVTFISQQTGTTQSKKIPFTKTYANVADIKDLYLGTGLSKKVPN